MPHDPSAEAARVVIWRSKWLPASETFVADHVTGLRRWRGVPLGLYREPQGLAVTPEVAPFPLNDWGRRLARASAATGYRGVYDRVLRRERPRLVHAHFGTNAVEVLPLARRLRLPLVVTWHGHDLNRAPQEDSSGRYRAGMREVFDYADRLVAVSDYVRTRLLDFGAPAAKIEVRYLGIPVRGGTEGSGASRGEAGIAFVGRLVPRKGVADLLTAYAGLPLDLRERHRLTIVGDGPERAALEQQAGGIEGGEISFLGTQGPDRVAEVLRSHAVFAGPSTRRADGDAETFGLTFLEAGLAGLPVLSYDYAGVPEAVLHERTGLLAPVGDVAVLGRHLQRLLADPGLADRLGAAGRQRVLTEFDLLERVAALEEMYDEIVGAPR